MEEVTYNPDTGRLEWGAPEDRKFLTVTRPYWLSQEEMERVLGGLVQQKPDSGVIDASEPVYAWFELTYAQFLTIPRIFLQAMPVDWQRRMVDCLNELDAAFDWRPHDGARFWVSLRGENGRYLPLDPNICDYRRGSVEHLRLEKEVGTHGR